MHRLLGLAFVMSALLGGCSSVDERYFKEGIGTEIAASDAIEAGRVQEIYLYELCREASPVLMGDAPECRAPSDWNMVVQSGFNDIDRRCDAYLAWLYQRRRTNPAIIKQLGDMTTAAQTIMRVAGVGADPITIVGIAFGIATNTFTNVNSSLLLEVDKTTVEMLVRSRRNDYRNDLIRKRISITNRPAAVHALRSYLTICTPFTIETTINSAITVYEAGGAKVDEKPLIDPNTVRSATLASATDPLPRDWAPPKPTQEALFRIQLDASLCVPRATGQTATQVETLRAQAIHDYLVGRALIRAADPPVPLSQLHPEMRDKIVRGVSTVPNCQKANYRNAYEVGLFGMATREGKVRAVRSLRTALKSKLGTDIPDDGKLETVRPFIKVFREKQELDKGLGDAVDAKLRSTLID